MFDQSTRKQLIPFVMAGYPSVDRSEQLMATVIEAGCQIIEVGVPFSDPMADGPAIQEAAEVALGQGVTLSQVFSLISRVKMRFPDVRIVLFTYLNPILKPGLRESLTAAAAAGVSAVLTVDLPVEEAREYIDLCEQLRLRTVFLASPTTSMERLKNISEASTGFLYYVSRAGVTGARQNLSETLVSELKGIRSAMTQSKDSPAASSLAGGQQPSASAPRTALGPCAGESVMTRRPIAVGFGISSPSQAAAAAEYAEAAVIGSQFISIIRENTDFQAALGVSRDLVRSCLEAMNPSHSAREKPL